MEKSGYSEKMHILRAAGRQLGYAATITECRKSNPTTTTKKAKCPIFKLDGYLMPL